MSPYVMDPSLFPVEPMLPVLDALLAVGWSGLAVLVMGWLWAEGVDARVFTTEGRQGS